MTIISFEDVKFSYQSGQSLQFPDVNIQKGNTTLVLGQSGVGKTTCLHLMAGLMKPKSGNIVIIGSSIVQMTQSELDAFRGKNVGVIFQQNHFISALNVLENIEMSQYLSGGKKDTIFCKELLKRLDIADKWNKKTTALSQGERQRVAIARSLAAKPPIILADEPTSALDDANTTEVFKLLNDQAEYLGSTLVIVTHDNRLKDLVPHHINLNKS
ncbi:MAG TPA: ATP-binding cassette domain-containing protein [Saprospiraceae bacterium]|nr:ATP-binding cassette domain-containing protein [Saprospiraceae bacterium]HPN69175.1 ATP-binding cassette domain-containing protein [Saprospiraceae bacterium]